MENSSPIAMQGKELFHAVIKQIEKDPEGWDQNYWHTDKNGFATNNPDEFFECGTTHCFAGWCEILGVAGSGEEFKKNRNLILDSRYEWREPTLTVAGVLLSLSSDQCYMLFNACNSLDTIKRLGQEFGLYDPTDQFVEEGSSHE